MYGVDQSYGGLNYVDFPNMQICHLVVAVSVQLPLRHSVHVADRDGGEEEGVVGDYVHCDCGGEATVLLGKEREHYYEATPAE